MYNIFNQTHMGCATLLGVKQGHVLVSNLVSFVSSTALRPVNYRSLCRAAFRFHSFEFAEGRLQVGGDW